MYPGRCNAVGVGGTNVVAIGIEAPGGDRPVTPPFVVKGPRCIDNLVGVGGTFPDVNLGVF
jgi:hypothetical protein